MRVSSSLGKQGLSNKKSVSIFPNTQGRAGCIRLGRKRRTGSTLWASEVISWSQRLGPSCFCVQGMPDHCGLLLWIKGPRGLRRNCRAGMGPWAQASDSASPLQHLLVHKKEDGAVLNIGNQPTHTVKPYRVPGPGHAAEDAVVKGNIPVRR